MWRQFLGGDEWGARTRAVLDRDLGTIAREQNQGRARAELVPWSFPVRDNIIANKDAAVMGVFEFDGFDTDSSSESRQQGLASDLNKLLVYQQDAPLSSWWTVRRTRTTDYPESTFPDPISRRIDDAMRRGFLEGENFVNRHFLTVAMLPATGALGLWDRIGQAMRHGTSLPTAVTEAAKTLLDDQRVFAYSHAELEEACDRLEHLLQDYIGMLPAIRFRRLSGDALGGFLHGVSSPQAPDQGLACSPDSLVPMLLDEAVPEGDMAVARDFLVFAGGQKKFTVVVTTKQYPSNLDLGGLDRLYSVPGEMTISYTVRHMTRAASETFAERMRNFHLGKRFSWKSTARAATGTPGESPINTGRDKLATDAATVLGRITAGDISGLWLYFCVLCHGDTLEEADATAERVEAVFRSCHLRPEREELHLVSAFATSIPGGWKDCARWNFFTSDAFAMIAPVHTVSRGEPENHYIAEQTKKPAPAVAVLPTQHHTPYYFSPHVHDLGHGALVGPSRSGKTVLANLIWTLFRRYPDAQVFVLDKDLSSRIPILLQGGTYLDFSNEEGVRFNPLDRLSLETMGKCMAWIELLLTQRGYFVTAEDSKELEQSLRSTITLPDDSGMRRLSTVFSHLTRPKLKEALEPWIGSRVLARYFDNDVDGFSRAMDSGSRLMGLEVGQLLTHPQVAAPMMDHVFRSIDSMLLAQRKQGIVRPTFIHLAEVWHLIQNEHSANKLVDWLKTLAKRCAVVWMDAQSLEDVALSDVWPALRDNAPNRIFLPNPNATSESLYPIYQRHFDLSPNQIEMIASGTQKRDYFIRHGTTSRMVQVRLPPDILACLRSDMAAQIVFDTHYAGGAGKPGWQERYIEEVQGV